MSGDRLRDTALWMLITATSVFLLDRLFVVLSFFAYPLLLFGLAWLLSLVLQPLVQRLTQVAIPIPLLARRSSAARLSALSWEIVSWRMPSLLAVTLIYTLLIAVVIILIVSLVPAIGPQLTRLSNAMPTSVDTFASWIAATESMLRRLGFRGDMSTVVQPEALAQQAGAIGTTLIQQSLGIAGSIANIIGGAFLVLILSFYMTLDGPRMAERMLGVLPLAWRDEVVRFFGIVDRAFGGFLRAQLLQSLIYGLATAFVLALLGINEVALASVLAAILIAIPLLGSVFALLPPLLIVLVQAPDRFLWALALLFIAQQVLFNLVMPRLMGRSVGLHPLLVFAAMLVGGTVAGGWGLLFGIPVAGVAASVLQFIYQRRRGAVPAEP